MNVIKVPKESLIEATVAVTNGQSPGNSPMAKLQAATQLYEMSMNPMTGIDPFEVAKLVIVNGPFGNARNLQRSREDQAALLSPPQLPGMVGQPGGVGAQGVPQGEAPAGGAGLPNDGPIQIP